VIAKRSGVTAERLAGRIIVPHPAMPNMQLTVPEIRDIVAYILSLKPAR
jgi:mono/diheme cytochrome c family protein